MEERWMREEFEAVFEWMRETFQERWMEEMEVEWGEVLVYDVA